MVPPLVGLGEKLVMAVIRFAVDETGSLAWNVAPDGFLATCLVNKLISSRIACSFFGVLSK